jgi:hypothetical protein
MSDETQGRLWSLQEQVKAKLEADATLSGISIITENQMDIEAEIEAAVTTGKGMCAVVMTPAAASSNPNLPGPHFDDVTVVVRIMENTVLNRGSSGTRKPCSHAAELVARCLHRTQTDQNKTLLCSGIRLAADPENLVYDVTFKTRVGLA